MGSSTSSGSLFRKYRLHALLVVVGTVLISVSAVAFDYFYRPTQAAPAPFLLQAGSTSSEAEWEVDVYFGVAARNPKVVDASIDAISANWHPGSATMLLEISQFATTREALTKIFSLVREKTGQSIGDDIDQWHQWIWKQDYNPHPQYASFKKKIYERIDPRFAEYYRITKDSKIRLDEIRWGGVIRDGIPPLKNPKMLSAADADYLADTDVVFGVDLNGDSRCYPKRILAWHEMFKDTVGGESVCGVY